MEMDFMFMAFIVMAFIAIAFIFRDQPCIGVAYIGMEYSVMTI